MNVFQDRVRNWLSREAPRRASQRCFGLPLVLSTDIGLIRSENQDRVAAMRVASKISRDQSFVAVAVADGMGGMRDGGECATLALASFFYALTLHRTEELARRAKFAIDYANTEVNRFAAGKGGTTLSAVIIPSSAKPYLVHVGDSRVYAFGHNGIKRLTVDDSLQEAVGGHGRDLLQFIGMGADLEAHVTPIDLPHRDDKLAITTDGIHFLEHKTIASILEHSGSIEAAAERLIQTAIWCGGPDNASSAILNLSDITQSPTDADSAVQFWDPHGSLSVIWVRPENFADDQQVNRIDQHHPAPEARSEKWEAGPALKRQPENDGVLLAKERPAGPSSKSKPRGKSATKKDRKQKAEDIQLEIKIEGGTAPPGADDAGK